MLGPPEEMSPGELNEDGGMGRTSRGSDNVDPKLGLLIWSNRFHILNDKI